MPLVNGWALDLINRIQEGRVAGDRTTEATVNTHYTALRYLIELCQEHGINRGCQVPSTNSLKRPSKLDTVRMTLTINLKMNMSALPLPRRVFLVAWLVNLC